VNGNIFDSGTHSAPASVGLLILRVSTGLMLAVGHGWGKLVTFGAKAASFPDPLGIGHQASLACTIGTEFFCALLLAAGLATRVAAVLVAFTMAVAAFVVLAKQPWGDKELAVLYLVPAAALMLTGAGRYSIDAHMGGGKRR
jgi:putative oxidoreductase